MSSFIDVDSIYRNRIEFPNPCDFKIVTNEMASWVKSTRTSSYTPDNSMLHCLQLERFQMPYPRAEVFTTNIVTPASVDAAGLFTTATAHGLNVNDIIELIDDINVTSMKRGTQYKVLTTPLATTFTIGLDAPVPATITAITAQIFGNNTCRFALITPAIQALVAAAKNVMKQPALYINIECDSGMYRDTNTLCSMHGVNRNQKFVAVLDYVTYDAQGQGVWCVYKCNMQQTMRFKIGEELKVTVTDRYGDVITCFTDTKIDERPNEYVQTLFTFTIESLIRNNLIIDAATSKMQHI